MQKDLVTQPVYDEKCTQTNMYGGNFFLEIRDIGYKTNFNFKLTLKIATYHNDKVYPKQLLKTRNTLLTYFLDRIYF